MPSNRLALDLRGISGLKGWDCAKDRTISSLPDPGFGSGCSLCMTI